MDSDEEEEEAKRLERYGDWLEGDDGPSDGPSDGANDGPSDEANEEPKAKTEN